jgi:hypothetical protein
MLNNSVSTQHFVYLSSDIQESAWTTLSESGHRTGGVAIAVRPYVVTHA